MIRIYYDDQVIEGAEGERLLDALLRAGIEHRHVCGGHGFCTSCRVEVVEGGDNLSLVGALERDRLGKQAGRVRLACQARVTGNVSVRVPKPSSNRFSPFDED